MRNDFAVFILSHGRANNLITLKTLDKIDNDSESGQKVTNRCKRNIMYLDILMFSTERKVKKKSLKNSLILSKFITN